MKKDICKLMLATLFIGSNLNSVYSRTAEAGFYTLENLPESARPQNLIRAYNAAFSLGGNCSAIGISNDGYVLTAAHCLKKCTKDWEFEDTSSKPELYGLNTLKWSLFPENRICKYHEDFNIYDRQGEMVARNPRIVNFGSGYPSFRTEFSNLEVEDLQKIGQHYGDYVLLKYELAKPLSCIPVAKGANTYIQDQQAEAILTGERVWAIGYPGKTSRVGVPGSPGLGKLISFGTVTNDLRQNEYYQEAGSTEKDYEDAKIALLQDTGNFLSDMDIFGGNSGSMAINEKGELVGVNIAIAATQSETRNRYFKSIALTHGIDAVIRGVIGADISESKNYFKCSN